RQPSLLAASDIGDVIQVSDFECVLGCRLLASREAILVGGSSGATLVAACRTAPVRFASGTCVLIFPDRGERYLDTVFDDDWVQRWICPLQQLKEAVGESCND